VQALILTPTRELAQQVEREMKRLLANRELKAAAIIGGADFRDQKHKLDAHAHVLIGTPGRLLDHLRRGTTHLGGVRFFVLDEVDEMLQQGFADDVETLCKLIPAERQTFLCSATLNEEVRKLGQKLTKNVLQIDVAPEEAVVAKIHQVIVRTTLENKLAALSKLIDRLNPYLMIVFCISRERASEVEEYLGSHGYNTGLLTGDQSPAKRRTVMKQFRDARLQILVASDIAARGLDVEGVTHVVNYDIPHSADWYVHRVGRTGRAGRDGMAVTLYTPEDLRWLHALENKLGIKMEKQNLEGKTMARRVTRAKPKATEKSRGKNSVADKRHAPKTGSNRRQKPKSAIPQERKTKTPKGKRSLIN